MLIITNQTLENSIDFTYENDDLFFGFNSSIYETLREDYTDKYEYIYPDITVDKNLFSSNKWKIDLQSNYQVKKYETSKFTNFFINDFDWSYKILNNSVFNSKLLGNVKNINYETKNIDIYKKDTTSGNFWSIGIFTKVNFEKSNK